MSEPGGRFLEPISGTMAVLARCPHGTPLDTFQDGG